MPKETPNTHSLQEARRGLAWALLLGLAILAVMVALFMGFVLLRLLPYAGLLATSSEPLSLPSGERIHPSWFRLAASAFVVALGLAVASVWGLLWLRRAWARTKAEAPLPKKTASSPGKKPRKKRKP